MTVNRCVIRGTLALMAIWCILTVTTAQEVRPAVQDPEGLFSRAVAAYDRGEYREAAELFGQISAAFPGSPRVSGALIMRAKAMYWAGENMECARVARELLSRFPASLYAADAHFVLGSVFNRIGRTDEALQEYARAWESLPHPVPPRLLEALGSAVDTIAVRRLSPEELQRAITGEGPRDYHARLLLNLAEKHAAAENTRAARLAIDSLLSTFPEEQGQPRVMRLLAQIAERSDVRLGVLLPLMRNDPPSAAKQITGDVYDGIEYAVDQFMRDPFQRIKVTLVTRDTERDPATASRLVRELASDPGVVGIIGPVFSSSTVTAAHSAQDAGIPLISPTANANGIAATGPFVFQANPDYDTRGRAMARFAIQKKGFHRLAVLAPSNSYGKFLAESFIDEARRLGAFIVATEWYERGKSDLSAQMRSVRRAGLRLGSDPYIAFGGKKKLGELMKLVGDMGDASIWAVGRFDAISSQAKLPAEVTGRIPPITWFAAKGHVDGGVQVMVKAETKDDQSADNLRDIVRGFVALAKMQAGNRPEAQALWPSIEMGGTGKTVSLSFGVSTQLIDAMTPKGGFGKGDHGKDSGKTEHPEAVEKAAPPKK